MSELMKTRWLWTTALAVTLADGPLLLARAGPLADLPEEMRCAPAVGQMLSDWRATGEIFRDPAGLTGDRGWRLPTETIGIWVRVTVDVAGVPTLERIDGRTIVRTTFGPSCAPRRSARVRSGEPSPGFFDDADLTALAESGNAGVIYVWSPHMPLSVDGYRHAVRAARSVGVGVTALLDPTADTDYARRVAATESIPGGALRPFRSVELTFRNATVHAPSLLVYARGRVLGLAVPGYRDAAGYRAVILRRLGDPDALPPVEPGTPKEQK